MLAPFARFIDDYRIWHKVTFRRGRILATRGDAWHDLGDAAHFEDPRRFFSVGGAPPDLAPHPLRESARARVSGYTHKSMHPIAGDGYARWERTNLASGWLYERRDDPDAPVVVLSHGWAHDEVRGLEKIFVHPLLRAGFSVAIPAHAFHFDRTPAGTYSGEMMVSGDVVLTVEAFRQSVADLSGLVSWLRARSTSSRRVGVIGYSLGGYIAGLLACVRDDLEFLVIAGAGDSVVSPILDTGLGVNVREDLSLSGMDHRENLERAWGIISPGQHTPRVPQERILLVAGLYDRIMLPRSVDRLREAWGRPAILWEPQGHYSLLAVPGRLVRRVREFLREATRRPA